MPIYRDLELKYSDKKGKKKGCEMFKKEFFKSDVWHRLLVTFAETRKVPGAVVEFYCVDETSFKVATLLPLESCLLLEVYEEEKEECGDIEVVYVEKKSTVRILPYEQIKYIDLKVESEKVRMYDKPPMGFRPAELKEG